MSRRSFHCPIVSLARTLETLTSTTCSCSLGPSSPPKFSSIRQRSRASALVSYLPHIHGTMVPSVTMAPRYHPSLPLPPSLSLCRICKLRQPQLCSRGHICYEWVLSGLQEAQSPVKEAAGTTETSFLDHQVGREAHLLHPHTLWEGGREGGWEGDR